MRYYFEVPTPDGVMEYWWSSATHRSGMPKLVTRMARRIWQEGSPDSGPKQVILIKPDSQYLGTMLTSETLKEFVWVKLQAQPAD